MVNKAKQELLKKILQPGELYAGIILGSSDELDYHLILLSEELSDVGWNQATDWARAQNASLPSRREQALLYANLKEEFESAWYWSSEQLAALSDCAWLQGFAHGYQYHAPKSNEYRACAVRRVFISEGEEE